jgi:ubiquinone/menaquinone biosynthesis C-methylase UbiE
MVRQFGARHVTAVDIAETRVAIARKNVERAGFADRVDVSQMDAHQLAFPDGHFDFIYCNSVMLFLDRERFFPEAVRLLKPGGRLVLFRESLDGNPMLRWYRALWPAAWKRGAEKFAHRLTVGEIDKSGQRYFQSVEHREFYLFFTILYRTGPWVVNRLLRGRTEYSVKSTWAASLDQAMLRTFPWLRRFAWVTVACFTTRAR